MRVEPKIAREQLIACLEEQYGLVPATIDFLPIGRDLNAGVYRVVSEKGASYLLKVKSGEFYGASCIVPRYLSDQGIESVVAPLRTRTDDLWTRAGEWTALVYPYVEGDTGWTGMSEDHWKTTGAIFRRVHEVALPSAGFDGVRRETFDPSGYTRSLESVEIYLATSKHGGRKPERALRDAWAEHRSTMYALLTSMDKLAGVLRSQANSYVICHGDLHPGNLLRDRAGNVFVVDWDDVMLAPRERDFTFVGEPADGSAQGAGSPFFEGYGETEVDWTLLTYYRYERVITDLIEDAQQVLLRDDLSEQAKAEAARQFRASLEGRNFDAAQTAAAHIPEDLTVYGAGRGGGGPMPRLRQGRARPRRR
jgi:spectinomycin phosphotransferase